jgi:hypothetical protein
MIKRVE